jgi:putative ABC transport system permease protein
LVWQFSRPVLLANIIDWPVSWCLMRDWLDGFANRIDLEPMWFIGAGGSPLSSPLPRSSALRFAWHSKARR